MEQIKRENACLAVIDFQERLMPVIHENAFLEDRVVRLIAGAKAVGLPILVTQQYTKGIGETVAPIGEALGDFAPIEKTSFSCFAEPAFRQALEQTGKKDIILCGIEGHICVMQTAAELQAAGYRVFLAEDCCASRSPRDYQVAVDRMAHGGVVVATMEALLMELIGGASAPAFREISKIIK